MKRFTVILAVLALTAISALFATTALGCSHADPSGCYTPGAPAK